MSKYLPTLLVQHLMLILRLLLWYLNPAIVLLITNIYHTRMHEHTYTPTQDTLVESGYSQEESEEIIARVLSVIDSTEHFVAQTTTVLEEVHLLSS